jgi:hypothetical protein
LAFPSVENGAFATGPPLEEFNELDVTVPSEFTVLTLTPGCADASPVARIKARNSNATFLISFRILTLIYQFPPEGFSDESRSTSLWLFLPGQREATADFCAIEYLYTTLFEGNTIEKDVP